MRVFITGATGFIGSRVVRELIGDGHRVLGLARSEERAAALTATGAEVLIGSIADLNGLQTAAARSDAVIHLAFNHNFATFVQNCEDDRGIINALASGLAGTNRPLIVTSGTGLANTVPGEPAKEGNPIVGSNVHPRAASEEAAAAVAATGVNVSVVRLPQVHDRFKQGLITPLIQMYLEKGVCAYVGNGCFRWPAAPVDAVAHLYKLAVEKAEPGAKYHAVAEEGVAIRDIAQTLGQRLSLPVKAISLEEAPEYFGWLARFANHDVPASSAQTREKLEWNPTGPTLLADLAQLQIADH